MSLTKRISSPMSSSSLLIKFMGTTVSDSTLYRIIMSSIQYLALTRLDIGFAVTKVSKFMQCHHDSHWIAVKCIMRCLKSTFDHCLYFYKSPSQQLIVFSDSEWAGCLDDKRFTSSYCLFLDKDILSWSSKKQPIVSRSSTLMSEYKALANASTELIWIQSLLSELEISLSYAPILHCDNIGETYLNSNPIFPAPTKCIEIDYHFVRDCVVAKALDVRFLSIKDHLANILTKPLVSRCFSLLKFNLNVHPPTSGLRGLIRSDTDDDDQ